MELNHKNLTDVAVKWLQRNNSSGGHGCNFAVSEVKSGHRGEIPDAIGFRNNFSTTDTIIVEVKISRSDFLADKKKPHRSGKTKGLGDWRYYMCPTDLIKPEELPDKFGLLYVNSRGHVKPIVSPYMTTHQGNRAIKLKEMKFNSNRERSMFLMTKLLSRVGNVEKANAEYKRLKKIENDMENQILKFEKTKREHQRQINRLEKKIKK